VVIVLLLTELDAPYRDSGLVVRPRGCLISTVQVRVGENHNSVTEVTASPRGGVGSNWR
jgi:hypothetical protein